METPAPGVFSNIQLFVKFLGAYLIKYSLSCTFTEISRVVFTLHVDTMSIKDDNKIHCLVVFHKS